VFAEEEDVALDGNCYAICPMIVSRRSLHEKEWVISDQNERSTGTEQPRASR
jgi:hypothetical protein